MSEIKKVVLAYSGGLDTSVILKWLQDTYQCEVSPCTSPKHAVSCIGHRLVILFLHDSIHVSMPFSQIIPPSPS